MQLELQALLQACKEAPDDPTPRMILADWLEEHDLADRADCVRLSCRCEQLPEDDSRRMAARAMLNDPRRETGRWLQPLRTVLPAVEFHNGLLCVTATCEDLVDRAPEDIHAEFAPWLETLQLHDVTRSEPLADLKQSGWLGLFTVLHFDQGSLAVSVLAGLFASDSDNSAALAHLCCLRMRNNRLGPARLSLLTTAADELSALCSLNLSGNQATGDEGVLTLAASPLLGQLTHLDLSLTNLSAAGVTALAQSPFSRRLVSLNLGSNGIDGEGLAALATGPALGALRRLGLAHATMSREGGADVFRKWPANRPLAHLDLSLTMLAEEDAQALAASSLLASLQSLNLQGWELNPVGLRALLVALPAGRLQTLDVANTPLGDAGARLLANSPALAGLRELSLENTGVGPEGAAALASSPHLLRLEFLDLSDNPLGAAGFQALFGAPRRQGKPQTSRAEPPKKVRLPGLRAMSLSRTNPTRGGLEALAASALLSQLEFLNLSRNRLGAAGAEVIASSVCLEGVRYLNLGACSLGDEGVRALAGSVHLGRLKGLDLGSNRITDAGVRSLVESAGLKELAGLSLFGNPITDVGGAILLAWRPGAWAFLHVDSNRMSQEMTQQLRQAAVAW